MAHVHDKQRIKTGNKTWPMYMINKGFLSLFFVYHVHGPCFVSYLYSLAIKYCKYLVETALNVRK
jgi:hypothetical protein